MNNHGITAGDLWVARTEPDMLFVVLDVHNDYVYYRNIKHLDIPLSLTIKNFLAYRVKMK